MYNGAFEKFHLFCLSEKNGFAEKHAWDIEKFIILALKFRYRIGTDSNKPYLNEMIKCTALFSIRGIDKSATYVLVHLCLPMFVFSTINFPILFLKNLTIRKETSI